jgi:hypothetical protein
MMPQGIYIRCGRCPFAAPLLRFARLRHRTGWATCAFHPVGRLPLLPQGARRRHLALKSQKCQRELDPFLVILG